MRNEEKPFIMTRYAWGGFNIEPRNARGWRLLLGWISLSLLMIGGFALFSEGQHSQSTFAIGLGVFLLGLAVWTVGGIIWMRARSEVVDVEDLLRLKREAERNRRRGR